MRQASERSTSVTENVALQNSISSSNKSHLPPSEAQDRLDDSVRMLLQAADGLSDKEKGYIEGDVHRISILNTRYDMLQKYWNTHNGIIRMAKDINYKQITTLVL